MKKGKIIFEKIPKEKVPLWGGLILSEIKTHLRKEPSEIEELRKIIRIGEWKKASKQFSKIRELTLNNQDLNREKYFHLAENIAKITYNETSEFDKYNLNSGFRIYGLAYEFVKSFNSINREERMNGILNLFNSETDHRNFFAIETKKTGEKLIKKILNSHEKDMARLKMELPENCTEEEISLQKVKLKLYGKGHKFKFGCFEAQYDLMYKESKIGYYSLLWDDEINLIDEFFVIK